MGFRRPGNPISVNIPNLSDDQKFFFTRYFLCLFLANIQSLPEEPLLPDDEIQKINRVLEAFLLIVTPSEIGDFQEAHTYVWITLLPFLQLALTGPSRTPETRNDIPPAHVQVPVDFDCKNSERVEEKCERNFVESCRINPYKFSPTQKLGLFCLCHLVTSPENRELLRKEKLVDYLICTCWFAQRCPEVDEITPELDGFERLEPPRLESIAKAYLAKCFGMKIM